MRDLRDTLMQEEFTEIYSNFEFLGKQKCLMFELREIIRIWFRVV